jgi:hypothetical protein
MRVFGCQVRVRDESERRWELKWEVGGKQGEQAPFTLPGTRLHVTV